MASRVLPDDHVARGMPPPPAEPWAPPPACMPACESCREPFAAPPSLPACLTPARSRDPALPAVALPSARATVLPSRLAGRAVLPAVAGCVAPCPAALPPSTIDSPEPLLRVRRRLLLPVAPPYVSLPLCLLSAMPSSPSRQPPRHLPARPAVLALAERVSSMLSSLNAVRRVCVPALRVPAASYALACGGLPGRRSVAQIACRTCHSNVMWLPSRNARMPSCRQLA